LEDPRQQPSGWRSKKDADDGLGLGSPEALLMACANATKPFCRLLPSSTATSRGKTPQFVRQGRRLTRLQLSLRLPNLTPHQSQAADCKRTKNSGSPRCLSPFTATGALRCAAACWSTPGRLLLDQLGWVCRKRPCSIHAQVVVFARALKTTVEALLRQPQ